jgi:hypothetical protein
MSFSHSHDLKGVLKKSFKKLFLRLLNVNTQQVSIISRKKTDWVGSLKTE